MLIIQILLIFIQLCPSTASPLGTSLSPKTSTYSNMCSCRGTCFAALFTLSLIPGTPGAAFSTTATPASIENVGVYLVITISARVNIAYKQVTEIIKNVQAVYYWLSELKDSLSKIKDELIFIRCGITVLIYNTRLLDMEFK